MVVKLRVQHMYKLKVDGAGSSRKNATATGTLEVK